MIVPCGLFSRVQHVCDGGGVVALFQICVCAEGGVLF